MTTELQQMYRNVFASREGAKVLGHIADTLCHVFDPIRVEDVQFQAERNVGLVIMQMAGVFDPLYTHLGIPDKEEHDGGYAPKL
jgi:hypothetical protein